MRPPQGSFRDAKTPEPPRPGPWTDLFDGKSLGDFRDGDHPGGGPVRVKGGVIEIGLGENLTGITWAGGPLPRDDYEIEIEAARVAGDDFFCGLTFPVKDAALSLIVGGWAGAVVGLSTLDGRDASENETTRYMSFTRGRSYRIHLRVTGDRVEARIDGEVVVSVSVAGRALSIRPEVEPSLPLGLATWRTSAVIRAIRLRRLVRAY